MLSFWDSFDDDSKKSLRSAFIMLTILILFMIAMIVWDNKPSTTVDEQVEDEEVSTQTDVEQDPIIEIKPVSFEDFKKIQWYMSFDEVCRILGTQPSEQEHTEEGLMVYTWYGKERNDDIVGYCKITFRMDYVYDFEADELL